MPCYSSMCTPPPICCSRRWPTLDRDPRGCMHALLAVAHGARPPPRAGVGSYDKYYLKSYTYVDSWRLQQEHIARYMQRQRGRLTGKTPAAGRNRRSTRSDTAVNQVAQPPAIDARRQSAATPAGQTHLSFVPLLDTAGRAGGVDRVTSLGVVDESPSHTGVNLGRQFEHPAGPEERLPRRPRHTRRPRRGFCSAPHAHHNVAVNVRR